MLDELGLLKYHERQRERFRTGQLVIEWHESYPSLFDKQDFKIAANQAHLGYHFFEWLAAIILYKSLGLLSLVEQYEFRVHQRKQEVLTKTMSEKMLSLIREHQSEFGNVQCPDLLVYAPDYSDWFFCEVKGPGDRVRDNQLKFFEALAEAGKKPIRVIKFRRLASAGA